MSLGETTAEVSESVRANAAFGASPWPVSGMPSFELPPELGDVLSAPDDPAGSSPFDAVSGTCALS